VRLGCDLKGLFPYLVTMSCFMGKFTSLPGVRCDRFDSIQSEGNVAAADQFFLSHCHADHMKGIDTLAMFLRRKANGTKINHKLYCSEISKNFVMEKYRIPPKTIHVLKNNEPHKIFAYDGVSGSGYHLKVTAVPANHCPGSVMFLFERLEEGQGAGVARRILYTGDFRFDHASGNFASPELASLHDRSGRPLPLDELYLDTTFCSPLYKTFPTREEAQEEIWSLCKKWVTKNGMYKDTRSKHVVLFVLPAKYGYEGILNNIYQRSRNCWRVHVNQPRFSEYLCSSELSSCTSDSPNQAQWLHACQNGKRSGNQPMLKTLPCQSGDFEVCQIRPSAMFFTQTKMAEQVAAGHDRVVSVSQGGSNYRVCYSTHSSMEELERFVRHFAGDKTVITPCAIPPKSSKEDVKRTLASWLCSAESSNSASSQPSHSSQELFSLSLSPHKPEPSVISNPDRYDPDLFSSPDFDLRLDRKRRSSFSREDSEEPHQKLLKLEAWDSSSRISFDDTMDIEGKQVAGEPDSSEEEERERQDMRFSVEIVPSPMAEPAPPSAPSAHLERRKLFARSKSEKTMCSMPIPVDPGHPCQRSPRRKSEPTMPLIKVTPSSPSPDPNHPDYPEFFEGRIFLEQQKRRKSSSRTSSSSRGDLENFSLMLEASDLEGEESEEATMLVNENVEGEEILAPLPEDQADPAADNYTPPLVILSEDAKQRNLEEPGSIPANVFKILEQSKGKRLGGKIPFMQPPIGSQSQ